MKRIAILGSTGSIGAQTMDVIRSYPSRLKAVSLVAYSNADKLEEQSREFKPQYTALISKEGEQCLVEAVRNCDIAVVATRGICALDAVLFCLDNNIDVALANKETLVCAGKLIIERLKSSKARLLPIDSEHYALSQCLLGRQANTVSKLLLTASGGPFWDFNKNDLHNVTPEQALRHPNWSMGSKITVDSATMMNKALEVVEARWLFGMSVDKIQIVVHRQSVVHSMVEFNDGSVMAQLANPDMRIPIQTALLGETGSALTPLLDFERLLTLTFEACDFDKFPCARLGYEIFPYPDLCATVMNSANDACVEKFLQGELSFDGFYHIIVRAIERFANDTQGKELSVENIKLYSQLARDYALQIISE